MSELTPTSTPDVLSGRQGRTGRIRLNRPRTINALTTPMVRAVSEELTRFAAADVDAVWLDGAGERGLCAGGDVRAVREAVEAGSSAGTEFFEAEYAMNAEIATSPVPVAAWMDGIVMGGGVGVSVHAQHRLVTERTRLAMPETIIGFFPDVGALWWLARCPGESGTRMALTAATIGGADAVALGLADRLVSSADVDDLIERSDLAAVGAGPDEVVSPWLAEGAELDPLFVGDDAAEILRRLQAHGSPRALELADDLARRSPWAVSVTLAALRRAAQLSTVTDVLAQDRRLAARMGQHPDFAEGVRAQLVDKDRTPKWTHRSLDDVDRSEVEALFS